MLNKITLFITTTLLALLFVGLVFLNNQLLDDYRVDLTENKVYTLSNGTQQVLTGLAEPVTLYYFFSQDTTKGMTSLRNYANRVDSLLTEFEKASKGNVRINRIDPKAFSEAEDQAAQFGLTGATLGPIGEAVYFGIAGTNLVDDQIVIPFFDPQKEQFLEYDIAKMVYQLSVTEPTKVALLTDLAVAGGQNPMTGQVEPPMVFYTQLTQLFDVELLNSTATALPEATKLLIVVHPQNLNDTLQYAVDQFAMSGGRVIAFIDPLFESDSMAMMAGGGPNASSFDLLSKWGIDVDLSQIVLDAQLGLDIRGPDGGVVKHPGILGLTENNMPSDDVVTTNLDIINVASVGHLPRLQNPLLRQMVLLESSPFASVVNSAEVAAEQDPLALQRLLDDEGQFSIAAKYSGSATSAFDQAPQEYDGTHTANTTNLNVLVVADADFITDRFWVQQTNFFGETLFTPFANNGDFISNATENMSGSDALISIRSRGTFARPFDVVQDLERIAEAKFLEQEEILQSQLAQTEAQLAQLQNAQQDGNALVITPEQQAAIDEFVAQRVDIRKALREVRYELERDIDELGNVLKLVNIAVAPLVLIMVLIVLRWSLKRRARRQFVKEAAQ